MNLVAARCPNCNANLDVNPNNETMKCQYCGGAILIDDAITKYKLEISGKIEVKNLPKIDNYLQIADRNYNLKEYDEAYKNYNKIIELDPNNKTALLRYGICKTLLNNYIDFSLDYLINSFNEVVKLSEDDNTYKNDIEKFVSEVLYAVDESLYSLRKYCNSYVVNGSDIIQIQNKLISIVNCYEIILEHANESKNYIIEQLVSVLKDIIKDKNYKTGSSREGGNFYDSYKISIQDKVRLSNKLNYYQNMLNPSSLINSEVEEKDRFINNSNNLKSKNLSNIKPSLIAIDIFLCMLILGSFLNGDFLCSLVMVFIFLIITFNSISERVFKGDNKKKKYCIIILVILLLIFMGYSV